MGDGGGRESSKDFSVLALLVLCTWSVPWPPSQKVVVENVRKIPPTSHQPTPSPSYLPETKGLPAVLWGLVWVCVTILLFILFWLLSTFCIGQPYRSCNLSIFFPITVTVIIIWNLFKQDAYFELEMTSYTRWGVIWFAASLQCTGKRQRVNVTSRWFP